MEEGKIGKQKRPYILYAVIFFPLLLFTGVVYVGTVERHDSALIFTVLI